MMDKKFTVVDGELAISYWTGNKDVGEGEQEITKLFEGEKGRRELSILNL